MIGLVLLVVLAGVVTWWLKPPPGKLVIRTFPAGVAVKIDGQGYGTTPDTGLVVSFMRTDHHFLSLSLVGYETDTSTVWVATDQVLALDITMQISGMVLIRGGVFTQDLAGVATEGHLAPYYVDRTEVTVADFKAFRPDFVPAFLGDDLPATRIAREDAQAYCHALGKRLPTEAEWERACRGVQGYVYNYGHTYDDGRGQTGKTKEAGPVSVRALPPGSGGLYGMTGNVWEWCADGASPVLRGGAWYSTDVTARCVDRFVLDAHLPDSSFGFRCVKPLESF